MFKSLDTWIFSHIIFIATDSIHFHRFYIMCSTKFGGFLIAFFITLHSPNTLFNEINSRWLIYELINVLKITTSIASNLVFAGNTIVSCVSLYFLIIDLYLLLPSVIAQIFNPTAELVIPTGTPTNDANAEIETQPLTAEMICKIHT